MKIEIDNRNIIAALGIESLPEERKAAILNKVSELAQARVLIRIFESLPAPEREELRSILDKNGGQADFAKFIEDKKIDLKAILQEELDQVYQEVKKIGEENPEIM